VIFTSQWLVAKFRELLYVIVNFLQVTLSNIDDVCAGTLAARTVMPPY
jgi:hypothetical protein